MLDLISNSYAYYYMRCPWYSLRWEDEHILKLFEGEIHLSVVGDLLTSRVGRKPLFLSIEVQVLSAMVKICCFVFQGKAMGESLSCGKKKGKAHTSLVRVLKQGISYNLFGYVPEL
jgi:hypothetical protein